MRSISGTFALLAALSSVASATIALGLKDDFNTETYSNVAWIAGDDPCTAVYINPDHANPCGIDFTLSNGYTYFLQNCGDSALSVANADGSYNSHCVFNDDAPQPYCDNVQSSVQQKWICG
jgi:hypothetical protein